MNYVKIKNLIDVFFLYEWLTNYKNDLWHSDKFNPFINWSGNSLKIINKNKKNIKHIIFPIKILSPFYFFLPIRAKLQLFF